MPPGPGPDQAARVTETLYPNVINEVIEAAALQFEDAGISLRVLDELKGLWQQNLSESTPGLCFPWTPKAAPPPPVPAPQQIFPPPQYQVQTHNPCSPGGISDSERYGQASQTAGGEYARVAAGIRYMSEMQRRREEEVQRQGGAVGSGDGRMAQQMTLQQLEELQHMRYVQQLRIYHQRQQQEQERKQLRDRQQQQQQQQSSQSAPVSSRPPHHQSPRSHPPYYPYPPPVATQHRNPHPPADGPDDSPSSAGDEDEDEDEDEGGGSPNLGLGLSDDNDLGLDEDDPDLNIGDTDDPDKNFELMVCLYEKVTKTRHSGNLKWKVMLKDGVFIVGGREYVFGKGTAELLFANPPK